MTAVAKNVDIWELKDAKVYPLTADGTALTYGSGLDIPGLTTIGMSGGEKVEIRLKGDMKIRRVEARDQSYKITVEHSAASFDVFAAVTGGAASTSGTTPNTTAKFVKKGQDRYPYSKLAGLSGGSKDAGTENGANATLTFYKCKVSGPPVAKNTDTGWMWSWEAEAFPTDFDDVIYDLQHNETAATLP